MPTESILVTKSLPPYPPDVIPTAGDDEPEEDEDEDERARAKRLLEDGLISYGEYCQMCYGLD